MVELKEDGEDADDVSHKHHKCDITENRWDINIRERSHKKQGEGIEVTQKVRDDKM